MKSSSFAWGLSAFLVVLVLSGVLVTADQQVKASLVKGVYAASTDSGGLVDMTAVLAQPDVQKIQMANVDGSLEVTVESASTAGVQNWTGQTNTIQLRLANETGQSLVEIRPTAAGLELSSQGTPSETTLPLLFNRTTGQLSAQGSDGAKSIRILPPQVMEIAQTAGLTGQFAGMQLVEAPKAGVGDQTAFKVTLRRAGNFLGVFPVDGEAVVEIGAQSGIVLNVDEPLWLRLFGPLVL